jgi:hypothetical protein
MCRRRLLLGTGALALLGLLAGAFAALAQRIPADPISPEGAAHIAPGMTEAQVEKVLGRRKPESSVGVIPNYTSIWVGESGHLAVHFSCGCWDSEPRASGPASFIPFPPRPLLDRLRRLLGW